MSEVVHLFVSIGQFSSFVEMRHYIEQTYTEDGDGIDSDFMTEVGLDDYEPGCIEAYHKAQPVDLPALLEGASYGDQWIYLVPQDLMADAAICVFAPNALRTPQRSSLTYVGAFRYWVPTNEEW